MNKNLSNQNIKVVISTGQGRLHLIESAISIKSFGINVKVITGWIPSTIIPDVILNLIGFFAGRSNISYGLRKRTPKELNRNEIYSCSFSEFTIQFLLILSKIKLISKDNATVLGWTLFGWQSKKLINGNHIFHVRSGAGHGNAINTAKKLGMVVIADQSAAHPFEIINQLSKTYDKNNIPVKINSGLWKMVIDDCEKSDYVQVNSNYVKKSFVNNGFESSKIFVNPLGVRSDFFSLKKNYTINGKIKVLYTGSLRRWKGVHLIIKAIEILIDKKYDIQIDFVGSISDEIDIPKNLSNDSVINLHGHLPQDDLKSFFINSDMYVFPSYCEGAAQSLKEAMAAGLPVIATEQSGAPIVDNENGIIISDDSTMHIVESIELLSKNIELRKKIGKNATKTIKQKHTWKVYAENAANFYKKIIKEHKLRNDKN